MRKPVLCLLSLMLWLPAAQAGESSRYSMTPVEEGALRLDGRTGAVSLCRAYDAGWACEAVPDAHLDLQRETERLREENAALRAEIERLKAKARRREKADPAAKKQDRITSGGKPSAPDSTPGEETIEEMMTVLEKMVGRFREMLESLQKHPSEKQL